jgi:hypothetical protein
VDDEGHHQVMLDEIVDHKSDESAVLPDNGYTTLNARRHRRITTKGWKLCIQWKDGSASWEPLSDLKEAYPVQTAEYSIANKLEHHTGAEFYEYVIMYTDDILAIGKDPSAILSRLNKYFTLRKVQLDRQTNTLE